MRALSAPVIGPSVFPGPIPLMNVCGRRRFVPLSSLVCDGVSLPFLCRDIDTHRDVYVGHRLRRARLAPCPLRSRTPFSLGASAKA